VAPARRIRRGEQFGDAARVLFPPGGSAEGKPSFELFEARVLRIVERRMAETFEDLPEAVEGTGIRFAMTHALPYIPALVIYGMLVVDDGEEMIELVDIVIDDEYFDAIESDPDD
jgi:hypothetical protein